MVRTAPFFFPLDDRWPNTPGEKGLQDQRIIEAIFESAQSGRR
jgi:hypothetical protein